MLSRFSRAALASCVLVAPTCYAAGCVAARQVEMAPAEVPPIASIPVAPLPAPSLRLVPAASARASDGPSPQPETPAHVSAVDAPEASPAQTAEPIVGPAAPAPHVVLVDEPPYRLSHAHARRAKEGSSESTHDRGLTSMRERTAQRRHAEPEVVVGVMGSVGAKVLGALERTPRDAGDGPFRRCYEEGLRRDQRISGRVLLDLDVMPSGAVARADLASTTVQDESVVFCIAREAAHLAFVGASPAGGVRLEVTLAAGEEPVAVPRPVANADALRDALRASWPAVQQCYATELAKRPDAGGRLELRFRAKPSGEIVEVAEAGTLRFPDIDVTRCVLGVYRTARLPSGRAGSPRDTTFSYAMHFEAKR